MKKFKLLLLTVLLAFLGNQNYIYADDLEDTDEVIAYEKKENGNTPNSSNHMFIIIHKKANLLTFNLPEGIQSASVIVYNESDGWVGFVTRENNSVMLPFSSGIYNIEIDTNDGRIFIGIVSL